MSIYKVENKESIFGLFKDTKSTFLDSYFQNCMGEGFADNLERPRSAMIIVGDMIFLRGRLA